MSNQASADKIIRVDDFAVVNTFIDNNGVFPHNTYFNTTPDGNMICYSKLLEELLNDGATILFKSSNVGVFTASKRSVRKIYLQYKGDVVMMESVVYKQISEFANIPAAIMSYKMPNDTISILGALTVLHSTLDVCDAFVEKVESCYVKSVKYPTINIISRDSDGFFLNSVRLEDAAASELDMHYGDGFALFHEKLVNKLVSSNKGLTLLHGSPGTGKSYYIRKLVTDLHEKTGKKIIIVPNSMINYITDPDFNTFLLETADAAVDSYDETGVYEDVVENEKKKEKGMILIMEDAESILMRRDHGSDTGTSNLLNLTSGLLNDIFGTQIIVTYNTEDKNIDPALMRSKRMIAKHTFNKLNEEQGKKLALHISIDPELIKKSMSVAEIYSLNDEEEDAVLISKPPTKRKFGLI